MVTPDRALSMSETEVFNILTVSKQIKTEFLEIEMFDHVHMLNRIVWNWTVYIY